jgi:hypothetical protein
MKPRKRTKLYPISERVNKVKVEHFAPPIPKGGLRHTALRDLFPQILAGQELRGLISDIKAAKDSNRPIIMMMGAHVIKVGLAPLIIQLMEEGYISHIALNGAGSIHDYEIALIGATSEDVATNLEDGRFGNWQETSELNKIIRRAARDKIGYGEGVGKAIFEGDLPYKQYSIFAKAYEKQLPITVHTVIGTEITHQHPNADGAALGKTSMRDFYYFLDTVKNLEGGVVMNWGSSVIMPEVFLKALTMARNHGHTVKKFTAANFDMIRHYRPTVNIVERPTMHGGKGYTFIAQHEIMLPLVAALLLED